MKSLTEIPGRNQTSSNIFQHDQTLPNMVFKLRQHVVASNVG